MSNYTQEPSNWRNVAKLTHVDGVNCAHTRKDIRMSLEAIGCGYDNCNECKMSGQNPDRADYIQQCKDRLAEEQKMGEKKPYDLTNIGPVLSLDPVIVEMSDTSGFNPSYRKKIILVRGGR